MVHARNCRRLSGKIIRSFVQLSRTSPNLRSFYPAWQTAPPFKQKLSEVELERSAHDNIWRGSRKTWWNKPFLRDW